MIGRTVGHYAIEARLGGGSMGVVYRATDIRLARPVAIKFMAPELMREPAATKRFLQEARAASALDHANICTVHDTGESEEGQLYLVMAYYEGETLAERIARGRVPVDEAVALARQIASGLHRAHQYGIVHRDVKPANLIVNRFGEVKLLDFGLAKLRGEAAATDRGSLLGTVPYMSPEQASGAPVDHRTDIWSLGVVLFEMLTGTRPFPGDTTSAIIAAILFETPRWDLLGPEVPPAIYGLLEHALQKAPETRIRSCQVMVGILSGHAPTPALWGLESRPIGVRRRSIIVMPFASIEKDEAIGHFGHGLADEITTALSRVESLRVMARSAAEHVLASGRRSQDVVRELGVEYIVEGAVRQNGTELRVSANLIDVRTGALAWAEQFSGVLEDIFSIQEQLSARIAEALRVHLRADPRVKAAAIADFASYDCYLRAKREFVRYEPGGLERALAFIESARERSGDNVLLLAADGQIHWQLVNSGSTPDRSHLDRARACAEQLLHVDPAGPHGPRLMGMVRLLEGDIRETIRLLELAAARDPNDTDTLSLLGPCYGYVGRSQAGLPIVNRLLELDPLTPMYQSMPGYLWLMTGSFDKAVRPFRTSYERDPGNPLVALSYGQCLALDERVDEAIEVFDALQRRMPGGFMSRLGQLYRCALQHKPLEATTWITPELEAIASWDLYHSWNLAQCHALLGDRERGLHWLGNAVDRGLLNYPLLVAIDPFLASIRDLDGFHDRMAAVRVQWEALLDTPSAQVARDASTLGAGGAPS